MIRIVPFLLLAALAGPVAAQENPAAAAPQFTVTADNPVPATTVVPVQQSAVQVGERTVIDDRSTRGMTREERRALKARRFAERIDSLVQSRDFIFWPNSMQQVPGGTIHLIYNESYYFGLFVDHVEVHLPTERGVTPFVEALNFDSMRLKEYAASAIHGGWNIRFRIADGDACYIVDFVVSTLTGETILSLLTPTTSMRYVGSIDSRERRFRPVK
ncbi:hypothetical protein [uncultured Alistipes sp.]|uniref:hypothetical protein n=1 Tax=uncultured Alistipes sp. TaxID=538949 RepID=UPI00262C7CDA|nr:hypothetical protein [uncultured Alistipes sp.]